MEIPLEDIYAYKASSTIHFQQTILVSYFWQPMNLDFPKIIVVQRHFVYKGFWQQWN
jgi:hypothetical protein